MAKFLKKLLLTLAVVIVGLVIAVVIVWAPELQKRGSEVLRF